MKHFLQKSIIASFILFFLFRLGCMDIPKNLIMPQWDVDLNVPIVNRSYTLNDIIKNQPYISVKQTPPNGSIYLIQSDTYSQSSQISNFIQVTSPSSLTNQIIPVLNIDSSVVFYLPIPEGAELDSAKFTGGSFSFHFTNPSPFTVDLTIVLPAIIQTDGTLFTINLSLPPNSSATKNYNFAGDSYKVTQSQIQNNEKGSIELIVKAKAAGAPFGTLINMDFYSSNFFFSYVSGYLPRKSLGTQTENFSLNIGNVKNFQDKVTLRDANLVMNVHYISPANNPFDIEVQNLNIIGKRSDGSSIYLTDKNGNNNFNFLFINGIFDTTFSDANSNITKFISSLPDQIFLSANYVMNPNNSKVARTVTNLDTVNFQTSFSTKSFMAINNASTTDTTSIDLSSDDRKSIQNGQSANVTLQIQNGIPLASSVKISFTDQFFNPLFTLTDASGSDSISFAGASVDQNGEVTNATSTSKTVMLDSTQIAKFSQAYHAIYTVSLSTTNSSSNPPQTVAVRPDDQITIKAFGGVKYRIKSNNSN
ncbi:MAG: hypothetical protein ACYCVH_13525 [Ignavibacteriaceae bacterium]